MQNLLELATDPARDLKVGLDDVKAQAVLDMSGKYIEFLDKYAMNVAKDKAVIRKHKLPQVKQDGNVEKALDEYYTAADQLCH